MNKRYVFMLAMVLLQSASFAGIGISLVDAQGTVVSKSSNGTLKVSRTYEKGDKVVITGAKDLAVKIDEHYAETLLYSPTGEVEFAIPRWQTGKYPNNFPYPQKAFTGDKHVITAREPSSQEIKAYRNLAANPMDARGKATVFPHADSASEWGEAGVFSARNAIDGFVEATGDHHAWPRQSWGPYLPDSKHGAPEILIEFGRPVTVDKLVFVQRHNVKQGGFWKEITVEFSDGTSEKLGFEYVGTKQERAIRKRTVTHLKLVNLVGNDLKKHAGLIELEVWGTVTK